mmetsp:Transcript_53884/g.163687  ORF Transcript_53884/g.163687 Transcript_53884/m.163687 type:complete len:239 (+) Transcript_53884:965-1681(+)
MVRGVMERSVPKIVGHVEGRIGQTDSRHDVLVPAARRLHQRGPPSAALVGHVRVGAAAEQRGRGLPVPLGARINQRRVAVLVGGIDQVVITKFLAQQHAIHELRVAVVSGKDKRGIAVLVDVVLHVCGDLLGRQPQLLKCAGLLHHWRALVKPAEDPREGRPNPPEDPREGRDRQNAVQQVEHEVQRPHVVIAHDHAENPEASSDGHSLLRTLASQRGGCGPAPRLPALAVVVARLER